MNADDLNAVVVLVEPAGPLNIGSVARLCANFGINELRLVAPRCDHLSEQAMQMAVHGQSLLHAAMLYPDLLTAISDCRRTVGSCGRLDHGEIPLQPPDQALGWLLATNASAAKAMAPVALVFGREDRGLSNSELRLCQRVLCLQSTETYPSLNLSHAVAVVLHELARLNSAETTVRSIDPPSPDPAAAKALSACLEDATDLLLEAGFLLEHTSAARMAKVRDLLQRATVRAEEVALLRGMVRQLRWAIRADRS